MQDLLSFIQNHWMLTAALIVVLLLLFIIELAKQQGTKRINPAEATRFINHEEATVVDLRSNDAYKAGHIVGSLSIPFAELTAKYKKLEKYKSKPIILVCATGVESGRAAALLAKYGIATYTLADGIRSWRNAELPLVKD